MLQDKTVAVIGGGIAGLSAADTLARRGLQVTVLEKASVAGGHAAMLSCKAVDGCVRCGACLAQEQVQRVLRQPRITLMTGMEVIGIQPSAGFELACRTNDGKSSTLDADALLLATGFAVYDPSDKPYGYGKFADVVTNLEAERMWRNRGELRRLSDGSAPGRIAFIQCVGSRDKRIGHNGCSRICCGSALRMARLVQKRQPDTVMTFFYIDVQTFGRNFHSEFAQCSKTIETIRAIPGDIVQSQDGGLQMTFYDPQRLQPTDRTFDMVILSTGLMPAAAHATFPALLGQSRAPNGFFSTHEDAAVPGLFYAGTALGPMSIAESIDSAGEAAGAIVRFLEGTNEAPCFSRAMRG
jgi:heterodisulfide reductase subunit A2